MSHLYLSENDVKLGYNQGRITVEHEGEIVRDFPFESIDGISVFGKAQLTTQLIRNCLAADVPIGYYSEDGHYFGKTSSFESVEPERQRQQVYLSDNETFRIVWSQLITEAKMRNSLALLNSYRDLYAWNADDLAGLFHSLSNIKSAQSVEAIMGFEGNAAKCYFACLPKVLINEDFTFRGRSTRPPKDPFNSLLSYGYSLLYRNITGAIERHGLHPSFAFMHSLKRGHAALASDLIEEYRAPLVDKTVVDLINAGEIEIDEFHKNETGGFYLKTATLKRVTDAFSNKITSRDRYFYAYGDGKAYSFQSMLDKKLDSVVTAIMHANALEYEPYIWIPQY